MLSDRLGKAAVVVVLALSCGACGGKEKPPLTPTPADEIPAASSDPKSGDTSAEAAPSPSSDATATPEGGDATGAGAAPALISCIALSVCSETMLGGKEAADAKERCKAASGQPYDLPCNHDNVAATCTVESKKLTIIYYKEKNPERMRGVLKGGKDACANAGGRFSAAPAAPPAPAAGKKKPAKKK